MEFLCSSDVLIVCISTMQIFLKVAEDSGVDAVELSGKMCVAFARFTACTLLISPYCYINMVTLM